MSQMESLSIKAPLYTVITTENKHLKKQAKDIILLDMPIQTKRSLIRDEQCQPSPFHDVFQTGGKKKKKPKPTHNQLFSLDFEVLQRRKWRPGGAKSSRVSRLANQCFLLASVLVHCIPTEP